MKNLFRDAYLLGKNELIIQLRNPLWLFFGLYQPIVYLLLFAPFLKGLASAPGFPATDAIQFFAPGLLIMNALFGASFAGFGFIDQLRTGFIERIRVTPVNRVSIALGLVFRTPVVVITQSILLILTALIFFHLHVSFWGLLVLLVLLALISIALASVSFSISLITKDEGGLAAFTNFFTLPLMLLSGIMLPLTFAPKIIKELSVFDPFTPAVDASRALMIGHIHEHSVYMAFLVFLVLGFFTLNWFIRSMKDAVA